MEEIYNRETKKKNEFMPLEPGFYRKVKEEFEEMQSEIARLMVEGDLRRATELSSELHRVRKIFENLIDARINKILMSIYTSDMSLKNLTKEERALHAELKDVVEMHRRLLLGEEPEISVQAPPREMPEGEEEEKKEKRPREEERESPEENYVLARIVAPTFRVAWIGGREIELRKEDVLHMPERMFRILLKREKVAEIKLRR